MTIYLIENNNKDFTAIAIVLDFQFRLELYL